MNKKDKEIIFSFFNEVGIIQQLASTQFDRVLPSGLKISQFSVLNHMVRLGDGRSPLELARAFQVTKAAMTHTLGVLAQRGMVSTKPNPDDGRGKIVSLTAKGKKSCEDAIVELVQHFNFVAEHCAGTEIEKVLPTLRHIRQLLDNNRET